MGLNAWIPKRFVFKKNKETRKITQMKRILKRLNIFIELYIDDRPYEANSFL